MDGFVVILIHSAVNLLGTSRTSGAAAATSQAGRRLCSGLEYEAAGLGYASEIIGQHRVLFSSLASARTLVD